MAPPVAPSPRSTIGAARIGIGLVQGLAGYGLFHLGAGSTPSEWVLAHPRTYLLACLMVGALPFPLLLGLGRMRPAVLAGWTAAAAVLILVTGLHELRQNGGTPLPVPDPAYLVGLGVALFVAHALVEAADASRRPLPRYGACFEAGWRSGVQLVLALVFVGAFWLVYWLGEELFQLIGLNGLSWLRNQPLFAFLATGAAGAAALHLADVQDRLTRGARGLGLTLLAWLAPLLALLAAGFLLSLPFTGLRPLWGTGIAASLLLTAMATLVLLINAVHQDGGGDDGTATHGMAARLLGGAARLGALVLPALAVLAGGAFWLRVGQYGLTTDRVQGIAALLVLSLYAVAYPVAALRPRMRGLETTNIVAAAATVLVLVALGTPLADPRRLAVEDQMARLADGRTPPERVDAAFLRGAGRPGQKALLALQDDPDPARAAIARRANDEETEAPFRLEAIPAGTPLPPALVRTLERERPRCGDDPCVALALDLEGTGRLTWLVGPVSEQFTLYAERGGRWRMEGYVATWGCGPGVTGALRAGRFALRTPLEREIEVEGRRLRVFGRQECAPPHDEAGSAGTEPGAAREVPRDR